MSEKTLYLIDASSFIWRAFYGLPLLSNSKGLYVNAITGFGTMLSSFLQNKKVVENNDKVLIICDAGRQNFRHTLYPLYKANRKEPPVELTPQFEIIKELVEKLNLSSLEIEGFEADDLIASYAKKASDLGQKTVIISSDKDLMQLINDKIKMYDPMKDKYYDIDAVIEKFGVKPTDFTTYQAITGDSSDNIPGIAGLGPKSAVELVNKYGTLENIFNNIGEIMPISRRQKISDNIENAKISYKLASLKDDIDLPLSFDDIKGISFDEKSIIDFCEKYELNRLKTSLLKISNINSVKVVNTDFKTNGYEQNLKQILTAETLYIYPFFDASKISQKSLCGLSIFDGAGEYFIPFKKSISNDLFSDSSTFFNDFLKQNGVMILKSIFTNSSSKKVLYDSKTLMHALLNEYDIKIVNYEDIQTLSFSMVGLKNGVDFESIVQNLTGAKLEPKYSTDEADFANLSQNAIAIYNVWTHLQNQISTNQKQYELYKNIDFPLIEVLFKMERVGILFDIETLQKLGADFSASLAILESQIYKLSGYEFNIASPKQLGEILFKKMQLPYSGKKGESYKTGVSQLLDLSNAGHQIADLLLQYRALSKLISTYTKTLINEVYKTDGRIHTTFLQNNVNTGRLASINPNLQNIPIKTELGKSIRKAFISRPNYSLISCDYSQIELRIMAHVADVKNLIQAFINNEDIHTSTAKKVFKCDEVCQKERRFAKIINFGIIYGMSSYGLSQTLNVPRQEAKEFIDSYFAIYPEILTYMKQMQTNARTYGFVETVFGRKCYFETESGAGMNYVDRASVNAPIQGASADLLRLAMKQISDKLEDQNLDAKLLLQIHDELVFEVADDQIEQAKSIIKQIMENVVQLKVPLLVDIGIGKTLYDIH